MADFSTEAYDLSLFEDKKARITRIPDKHAAKENRRHKRIQKMLNTIVTTGAVVLVLSVIGVMIVGQIRLTEMNNAITHAQDEYNQAISETKRLESELAAQTSAQSVEEYANRVGFRQTESGQIEYFTVSEPEQEKPEQPESLLARIVNALKAWAEA